jgi:holo-ACP synthase CitX
MAVLAKMKKNSLENIRKTILERKEKRWQFQLQLIKKYDSPVISFRFNIPSWPKNSESINTAFLIVSQEFENYLNNLSIHFQKKSSKFDIIGPECYYLFDGKAHFIKKQTIAFEKKHPIGRLLDIDILMKTGKPIERETKRLCFICNNDLAINCMRKANHSPIEARKIFDKKINDFLKNKRK